jgi:hypothetical protein
MEARATRKGLRAFPIDLAFTQEPTDNLRKFLDIPGRQTVTADEFIQDQLYNLFLETADPNEPSFLYNSGRYIPQDAEISGYWVSDVQDLVSMQVTGFDLEETIYPSGIPANDDLVGISFGEDPASSGCLYLISDGHREIYKYSWKNLDVVPDVETTLIVHQSYDDTETDEYLVLEQDSTLGTIAELKHEPVGDVTIIDVKNLAAPWSPETSDGIIADQSEITLSGRYVILETPRHTYSPATTDVDGNTLYPTDYQPDQYWRSSFIAEYYYYDYESTNGICQPTIRHNLGLMGTPIAAAKELEE